MDSIRLFCLRDTAPLHRAFAVEIDRSAIIFDLKESILQQHNQPEVTEPRDMNIFSVSIETQGDRDILNWEELTPLSPFLTVGKVFAKEVKFVQVIFRFFYRTVSIGINSVEANSTFNEAKLIVQCKNLRDRIWGKEASEVYKTRTISVPAFEDVSETAFSFQEVRFSLPAFPVLPNGVNRIIIRQDYIESFKIIKAFEKCPQADSPIPEHSIVFSGHPGIGKTCFLSYILLERLLKSKPTVLQVDLSINKKFPAHSHFLFDKHGVRIIRSSGDQACMDQSIWALTDQTPWGVASMINLHKWTVIVTSSRLKIFKELVKHNNSPVYYMTLWSWEEIVAASEYTKESDLNKLKTIFCNYGPIPRVLLQYLCPTRANHDSTVLVHETKLGAKIERLRSTFGTFGTNYCDEDSHSLLLLKPEKDFTSLVWKHVICSSHVGRKIGYHIAVQAQREGNAIYEWLKNKCTMHTAAGWVFEGRAHICFNYGIFTFNPLKPVSNSTVSVRIVGSQTFCSLNELNALVREKKFLSKVSKQILNVYLRPERCNFPSVDSLIISSGPPMRVFFFQMTISMKHPVKVSGLYSVWNELPAEVKQTPPIIVFVIEEKSLDIFPPQEVVGVPLEPATNWEQYVLGFSENELWNDDSKSKLLVRPGVAVQTALKRADSDPTPTISKRRNTSRSKKR